MHRQRGHGPIVWPPHLAQETQCLQGGCWIMLGHKWQMEW
jgi:hypothetical protein